MLSVQSKSFYGYNQCTFREDLSIIEFCRLLFHRHLMAIILFLSLRHGLKTRPQHREYRPPSNWWRKLTNDNLCVPSRDPCLANSRHPPILQQSTSYTRPQYREYCPPSDWRKLTNEIILCSESRPVYLANSRHPPTQQRPTSHKSNQSLLPQLRGYFAKVPSAGPSQDLAY